MCCIYFFHSAGRVVTSLFGARRDETNTWRLLLELLSGEREQVCVRGHRKQAPQLHCCPCERPVCNVSTFTFSGRYMLNYVMVCDVLRTGLRCVKYHVTLCLGTGICMRAPAARCKQHIWFLWSAPVPSRASDPMSSSSTMPSCPSPSSPLCAPPRTAVLLQLRMQHRAVPLFAFLAGLRGPLISGFPLYSFFLSYGASSCPAFLLPLSVSSCSPCECVFWDFVLSLTSCGRGGMTPLPFPAL